MSELPLCYVIVDAARDYVRIGMARALSHSRACLLEGSKGQEMEDLAPHLFISDSFGQVPELILAPDKEGEFGILFDAPLGFVEVRRHLRRFLLVRRQRDMKKVLFRYFDPRVLRAFLPVCTEAELLDFFGPITAFHCQGDEPGEVLTFTLREQKLHITKMGWQRFLSEHFPARLRAIQELGISKR